VVASRCAKEVAGAGYPVHLRREDGQIEGWFVQPWAQTPIRDKRVREALNLAIDRTELAETVFGGQASPAAVPFGLSWSFPEIKFKITPEMVGRQPFLKSLYAPRRGRKTPRPKEGHPAPFPEELIYRLIKFYSYRGNVVLDPFGGTGTVAFLVGLAWRDGDGLMFVQYFLCDFNQESALLWAVGQCVRDAGVLVSYNGRSFDWPLLQTRLVMRRADPAWPSPPHRGPACGACPEDRRSPTV